MRKKKVTQEGDAGKVRLETSVQTLKGKESNLCVNMGL